MTRRKNDAPPPADRAVADAAAARLLAQTVRSVPVRSGPVRAYDEASHDATTNEVTPYGVTTNEVTPYGVTTNVPLRRAIRWFQDTPRGAEAFLARYAQMPRPLRRALLAHYQTDDPWRGFREVCRLYGV